MENPGNALDVQVGRARLDKAIVSQKGGQEKRLGAPCRGLASHTTEKAQEEVSCDTAARHGFYHGRKVSSAEKNNVMRGVIVTQFSLALKNISSTFEFGASLFLERCHSLAVILGAHSHGLASGCHV